MFVMLISCGSSDEVPENLHRLSSGSSSADSESEKENYTNPEIIDSIEITHVALVNTNLGDFRIGLYGKDAPKTVENFISLARRRYYNSTLIHRVAHNFLIQAGDGSTKFKSRSSIWGLGGESSFGSQFEDELDPGMPSYQAGYTEGTVAMANKGPNTNTSQFFICLDEAKYLDKMWTIFGRVIDGMELVKHIASVEVKPSERGPNDGFPKEPIKIYSITIKNME